MFSTIHPHSLTDCYICWMQLSGDNIKIIFGLKIKQLRTEQGLSLVQLGEKSGLSVSYLNEIEKGKKYPTGPRIAALSAALDIAYDKLVSLKLPKAHAPIAAILDSRILEELPLDMLGIDRLKLVELISNAPARVNAFISTIIEIARNHEFTQEHFLLAVLRSYQESHENYFPELEKSAHAFAEEHSVNNKAVVKAAVLQKILEKKYGYEVSDSELPHYPEIKHLRAVVIEAKKKLLLNPVMDDSQRAFVMAKEIGFLHLGLKERPWSLPMMKVESFDSVVNNFKASYFAGALLMNEQSLVIDLEKFFSSKKWNEEHLLRLISKYTSSHETFIHRITNILPRHFGLNSLFFLRFDNKGGSDYYTLTKELHLSKLHLPHGSNLDEHYCRRWVSLRVLKEIGKKKKTKEPVVGIQRSRYHNSDNEYLVISIARPIECFPDHNCSVSVGLTINNELKKRVAFWNDESIPLKIVSQACERCPVENCLERAVPAVHIEKEMKSKRAEEKIKSLNEEG